MLDIRKMKITKTQVNENKDCVAFVIEPLERGYGTTFGSSLRRILLSSLDGAAVTSYKVSEGQLDEARMTDFVLNLKDLSLEFKKPEVEVDAEQDTDAENNVDAEFEAEPEEEPVVFEPVTVSYTAVGPALVSAADVFGENEKINAIVEDQPIVDVPEGVTLSFSLVVEPGHGYVPAGKLPAIDADATPIDALFSPVRRVDYKVSNTRVGNVTDYDSLTLTIHTDGTITPSAAFTTAAGMMIDKLTAFTDLYEDDSQDELFIEEDSKEDNTPDENFLEKQLDELDLSVRSYNALKRHGINTIGDLVDMTEDNALRIRNLGRTSFLDIKNKLAAIGLDFKKEEL